MARTVKNRRECYDNIALGGGTAVITTRERTVPGDLNPAAGALPPDFTTYGNSENIQVGVDYGQENDPVAQDRGTGERLG